MMNDPKRKRQPAFKMLSFIVFLLLLLSLSLLEASAQPLASPTELAALFSLRASLGLRAKDWPRKSDPCSKWAGLSCVSGQVTTIDLSGLRRTRLGRLRQAFAVDGLKNLTRLESFNSTGFALPGPIPAWLGPRLRSSLTVLVLSSAHITGRIPASLDQLSHLRVLDLSHNRISGSVPSSLANLTNLKTLELAHNNLTGELPAQLGDLAQLTQLNISHNKLVGELPDSVWALNLSSLDASFNNFTGTLPRSSERTIPMVLDLSNNLFYGSVLLELLGRFRAVNLSGNYFNGSVPYVFEGKNDTFRLNCFKDAVNQRSSADCEKFYKEKGVPFDIPMGPISTSPPHGRKKKQLWKYILAGVLGFIGAMIVIGLGIAVCLLRTRVRAPTANQGVDSGNPSAADSRILSRDLVFNGEAFTYEQLARATAEFSGSNLIKKGHSGDLYQGMLESGFSIVVKRVDLERVRREGYVVELDLFARASHTRLVPYLGHCSVSENDKFIVYKHMVNGDLSSALFKISNTGEEEARSLDWITRLKIAVGVAEALCFLHQECNPPLVHRDVQASSILLDDKFEVRLGSLSEVCAHEGEGYQNVFTRLLRRSQTSEQGASGNFSGSSTSTCAHDMYSFGKVLLELVTGKLGISSSSDAISSEWLDKTLRSINFYERDAISKIIDPSLVLDEDLIQEAWAVAFVAKTCMDPKPSKRPPARYVLKALENPLKVLRLHNRSGSAQLRATSSRASWHGAFFGSWRQSSSDMAFWSGPLRRSGTGRSQGSVGEHSFSRKRHSIEIFPEPGPSNRGDGGEE